MSFHLHPPANAFQRGCQLEGKRSSALVITLVFVLLLSIIVVAFFAHVSASLKVANNNANTTNVSLFAHGAVGTILGDLKQEIVDGSTGTQPAPNQWVYTPKQATNVVPQRVGANTNYPNLVKISLYGTPFYAGGTAVARAANSSSLTPSINSHVMTPARWNKALFLPRNNTNSAFDFTPLGANSTNNTWSSAPNWVLVSRNGANPTTWSTSLNNSAAANGSFIVGRYSYAIYDEGGLLDANAVGYPSGTPTTTVLTNIPPYRPNVAFADLTQLPGIGTLGSTTLVTQVINTMTQVRNYATDQTTEGYYRSALTSPNGFLTAANTNTVNGRTDRLFSSRQDLIQFMLQGMPQLGTLSASSTVLQQQLPTALQYMTHFSRALDQPSVWPPSGRPTITTGNGGNGSVGEDDVINPKFLNVRVVTPFTRYDGTGATAGEPLVKTRFALNRLAWLTYKGPIADDSGNLNPNADAAIQTIINQLEQMGLTASFLQRGGPTNIKNYFGLAWDPATGAWRYNVHNGSGGVGAITQLGGIPALTREPDFVELLKATINVGSLGKGCYVDTTYTTSTDFPPKIQYNNDQSTDYAILQLTANIIDQFDLDGFPTHILFDPGSGVPEQQFNGVENLPYLYRTRISGAEARPANPKQPYWQGSAIIDTGAYVAFVTPEIWNPHDQNCPRCALDSSGIPLKDGSGNPLFPTSFRIVASSTDPYDIGSEQLVHVEAADPASYRSQYENPTNTPPSVPFNGDFSFKNLVLNTSTTEMDFSVPNTTQGQGLFREPTMLMQYNQPQGSGLQLGPNNYMYSPDATANGNAAAVQGRLDGLVDGNGTVLNSPNGERYFGMYLGTVPIQWWSMPLPATTNSPAYPNGVLQTISAFIMGASQTRFVTYQVQAQDPNTSTWATYDQKYIEALYDEGVSLISPSWDGSVSGGAPSSHFAVAGGTVVGSAWDPRTTRFSTVANLAATTNYAPIGVLQYPVTPYEGYGGLDTTANAVVTDRPDYTSGFGGGEVNANYFWVGGFPDVAGWSPNTTFAGANPQIWHLGMTSINSASYSPYGAGLRWSGDTNSASAGPQYYADPDGVVRRAMAGYFASNTRNTIGLPLSTATTYSGGAATPNGTSQNRPMILNRPFATVAELSYAFSGTPWKNINFFTPESGDDGLLDVFCINETNPSAMVAGKVNLNTQQYPVLQAILSGSYKDDLAASATFVTGGTANEAGKLAGMLVARTTDVASNGQSPPSGETAPQPLINIGDLVGRWTSGTTYDGFSGDLSNDSSATTSDKIIQRRREAPIRALAACGQTRVWNLMIDLVAQTGRYPTTATTLDNFAVEGEQRLWVHLAIDRLTGQIIDEQIEAVHE